MKSKERPVRFGFIGSDGQTYHFLMKREQSRNTDVRKESRVVDMIDYLAHILRQDRTARGLGLSARSYVIISLTRTVNLVEWVEGTSTLKNLVLARDPDIMSRKLLKFEKNQLLESAFNRILDKVGAVTRNSLRSRSTSSTAPRAKTTGSVSS